MDNSIKTFRLKLRELAREDLEKSKEFFDSEYPRLVRELRMTYQLKEYIELKIIGQNFLDFYAEITTTNYRPKKQ